MTTRRSDFDLDMRDGAQAELWVASVRDTLAKGRGTVEVKAPRPFLPTGRAYVEYACRSQGGTWQPSGIAKTKATLWFLTFGGLPGGLVVETKWLLRAARLAYRKGQRQGCLLEPNPTRGVLVGLRELWETREGEP